jgi:aspartyl/asparaginyl beta-hydroxylase (cupin superfamily)
MVGENNKKEILNFSKKPIKYFYEIEDFPKFKILEDNYQGILNEVLDVIKKEKVIEFDITKITNEELMYSYIQNNKNGNQKNKTEVINLDNNSKNNYNFTEKNEEMNKNEFKTFEPWVEKTLYQESNVDGWDVAPLMIGGVKIPDRCKKFPFLFELVGKISSVISVSYSLLKPGTHIVPHKGYDDYSEKIYRFHMGIIIPEGEIGIRVEKDIRKWENGKSFVFDDMMIHEAWNFTNQNRLVLVLDFLKDDTQLPESLKFVNENFNKSINNYLNNENIGN